MGEPWGTAVDAAKAALRHEVAARWRSLDLPALSTLLCARAGEVPELAAAGTVAAYVSLPGEVDTTALLGELHRSGVTVLLPALRADGSLTWRVADRSTPLVVGRRGTREPPDGADPAELSDADVIVVPGLAFDPSGGRLGRGGGSYDRALAAERPGTVIALAPDEAVVDRVPAEAHDRRVDVVVTPTRLIRTTCR